MTRDEIIALFDCRRDAMNRRDIDALAALFAEDAVVESLMAGRVKGRPAIADVYRAWFKAFPDVVITTDDLLIDGNRVALVDNASGTDIGGFMGLPPTGRPFRLPIVHLYALQDGQIFHERRIYDFTGLLVQIGVLKAKYA